MEGPFTQRESRHCSPRNTALLPPANLDSLGENCVLQKLWQQACYILFLLWNCGIRCFAVSRWLTSPKGGFHYNPGFRQYLSQLRIKAQRPHQPRPAADAGSLPQGGSSFLLILVGVAFLFPCAISAAWLNKLFQMSKHLGLLILRWCSHSSSPSCFITSLRHPLKGEKEVLYLHDQRYLY